MPERKLTQEAVILKKMVLALSISVLALAGTVPAAHAQVAADCTTPESGDLLLFHATRDSSMYPSPSYLSPCFNVPNGTNLYCTADVTSATWRYCLDVSLTGPKGYMSTSEIAPDWV